MAVTGKIDFRIRRDRTRLAPTMALAPFQRIWLAGFKACLDLLIVELRGAEEHKAADLLENVRRTWPS